MEQIDGVTKVLSLVNAPYIKGEDGLLAVGTVWEQQTPWKAIQTQPMFRKLLSNESGTVQVIQVRVEKEREKVSDLQPVYDEILHRIQNHPPPKGINWQRTGVPHIRTEIVDLMLKDELFMFLSLQSCSFLPSSGYFCIHGFGTSSNSPDCHGMGCRNTDYVRCNVQYIVYVSSGDCHGYRHSRWNPCGFTIP